MMLAPALILERLAEPLLLDVDKLVEAPERALVFLDHQCAEREGLTPVRVIDRAARLAVHPRNLAVLVFVVGDDALEVGGGQRLADLVVDDLANNVEHLPLAELELPVTTDGSNGGIEMVENDIL